MPWRRENENARNAVPTLDPAVWGAYIPARIPEALQEEIRKAAVRVFRAIGCQGLSRVDFFATEDGHLVLNEINTLPGFTSISMYPKLFAASGIPYSRLIDELLKLAMEAGK